MVVTNQSSKWVMHTLEGAHELREAGLLELSEVYNGACKYDLDHRTLRTLQKNLTKLKQAVPELTSAEAVSDSGENAREAIANKWMSF